VRWWSSTETAPRLLANLDPSMSERVAEAARRHGIELVLGTHVEAITPTTVVTTDGELPATIVVLAIGVTPNTELAAAAGLATGVRDAVCVDDHQRASVDGVFSAGDCAESFHRVTGRPTWIALGTVANKAARVAAVNLAGGDAAHGGVLGTAITRLVDTEIARTGLTASEASDAGFEPVTTEIESWTQAPYLAEAAPIAVQLVHDEVTRRLLGGQIVGGAGAGKRIDTIATALWAGLEVDELVDLDLAYAPPFAPVWDPVNTAARRAARPR
jgi:NADPH-dependent 2,4-dienoyl-CoA reductase/sulfur reductase-like enzyme